MDDLNAIQRDIVYTVYKLTKPDSKNIEDELNSYYNKDVYSTRITQNIDILIDLGYINFVDKSYGVSVYETTQKANNAIQNHLKWAEK